MEGSVTAGQVPGPQRFQSLNLKRHISTQFLSSTSVWFYSTNFPLGCPPVRGQNQQEACQAEFTWSSSFGTSLPVSYSWGEWWKIHKGIGDLWGCAYRHVRFLDFFFFFKVYGLNNMLKGLCWASCFFFQAHVLSNTFVLIAPNCPYWTEVAVVLCSALYLPHSDALLESRILWVIWLPKHQVVPGLLLSSLYFPSALGKASHHFFLGILACISQLLPWLQGNSQLRRVLDINLLPNSPQKPTLNCVMS